MAIHIKTISDGSIIEFDRGTFDNWCVYIKKDGKRYAPKDIQYFTNLSVLARLYGSERIYNDFIQIYKSTTKQLNKSVLDNISQISLRYEKHTVDMDIWFTVIYAGMIAEENKEYAVLKKRIKRLGMYQLLIGQEAPHYAANFSKGKHWRELDTIMKKSGF